jgi:DNA (cytosine-5)-methyltransferase 1
MNELSLFTGAGGGLLGTKLLGWKAIGYVEKETYCQKVIRQRIADGILDAAPIFGDIRKFISEGYAASYTGMVDVITGGFPCQDISCAGTGKGIEGERSGLWDEMSTIIRIVRPEYVFVENSPMLTIRGLGTVLRDLAKMGFNARWGVLGAKDVGGIINRERLWIVASTSKKHGRRLYRWSDKKSRNMGNNFAPRSFLNRFMEELEGKGEQREQQRESDLPPYLCKLGDGMAFELDELKAIGNGQVPRVVAAAWRILTA